MQNQSKYYTTYDKWLITEVPTRNPERTRFNEDLTWIIAGYLRQVYNIKLENEQWHENITYETINKRFDFSKIDDEQGLATLKNLLVGNQEKASIRSIDQLILHYKPRKVFDENKKKDGSKTPGSHLVNSLYELFPLSIEYKSNDSIFTNIISTFSKPMQIENVKNDKRIYFFNEYRETVIDDIKYMLTSDELTVEYLELYLFYSYNTYMYNLTMAISKDSTDDSNFNTLNKAYFKVVDFPTTGSSMETKQGNKQYEKSRLVNLYYNEQLLGFLYRKLENKEEFITPYSFKNNKNLEVYLDEFFNELTMIDEFTEYVYIPNWTMLSQVEKYNELLDIIKQFSTDKKDKGVISRYPLNFTEHNSLFTRSAGINGSVFYLSSRMLIMFVSIIVKEPEMLYEDFLNELEKRGVWLDKYGRVNLITELKNKNLLIQKSDGGDIVYVKRV